MIKISEEKFKELSKQVIKKKEKSIEELDDPIIRLIILMEVISILKDLETLLFN